jgi:hypothetical protein
LVTISQVKVDGVALVAGVDYRVDDYRYLVRLGGSSWPHCQNVLLADTEPNTWSVIVSGGMAPPVGGQLAAGALAGELIGALVNPSATQLPPRTQTVVRQNLTLGLHDPAELFDNNLTGIPLVDLWVKSCNPKGYQRRATISSPDRPRPVRRIST